MVLYTVCTLIVVMPWGWYNFIFMAHNYFPKKASCSDTFGTLTDNLLLFCEHSLSSCSAAIENDYWGGSTLEPVPGRKQCSKSIRTSCLPRKVLASLLHLLQKEMTMAPWHQNVPYILYILCSLLKFLCNWNTEKLNEEEDWSLSVNWKAYERGRSFGRWTNKIKYGGSLEQARIECLDRKRHMHLLWSFPWGMTFDEVKHHKWYIAVHSYKWSCCSQYWFSGIFYQ